MGLPSGMSMRQLTAADIPAVVGLGDATWSALYGRPSPFTAASLEMSLTRPGRDPGRDDPLIFAGDHVVAGASLVAHPPMTAVVCPILVDLALPAQARSACIDALISGLEGAMRRHLVDADASVERVFGLTVPGRDTGLRDHVRGLGWTLSRTHFEMAIDLTGAAFPDVESPQGMTMRRFGEADFVESAISVMTDAFADHPGDFASEDSWRHWLTAETILPDASYLLDDADGPVGGLICADFGDGEGYIGAIGVRRRGRGKGAASAMLHRAFHQLAAAGYPSAALTVDAENPTGALSLYQRAGMSERFVTEDWVTPLPAK